MSREPTTEESLVNWRECAAMLSGELTYAHDALRLAKSMILSGEPMTVEAEAVIRRGLGVLSALRGSGEQTR